MAGRATVLNMGVRVEVTEVTCGQKLKGIGHETSGLRIFQVEGTQAWERNMTAHGRNGSG